MATYNVPLLLSTDIRVAGYRTPNGLVVSYEVQGCAYGNSADQSVNEIRFRNNLQQISVHTVNIGSEKRDDFELGPKFCFNRS